MPFEFSRSKLRKHFKKSNIKHNFHDTIRAMLFNAKDISLNKKEFIYWKQFVFILLSLFIIIACAPLFVYGAYMFYSSGRPIQGVSEICAYIILVVIINQKSLGIQFREFAVILALYFICVLLLIYTAITGAGLICILSTLFLSGCTLDGKQLRYFVIINVITFIILTLLLFSGRLDGTIMRTYKSMWLINAITTQVCGIGLLFLFHQIYKGLEKQTNEIKESNELLYESEKQFRIAVEESPVPIMLHTEDGSVIKLSNAWTELTGYTLQDIPTVDEWKNKALGSNQKELQSSMSSIFITDKRVHVGEYLVKTNNSQEKIWDLYSALIGKISENRKMVMSVAIDITKNKQAEQEYKTIIQTAIDGFWITDQLGKFIDVNNSYCMLIGYTRKELLTMSIGDVENDCNKENIKERLERIIHEKSERSEAVHQCKDGRIIYVEISYNVILSDNVRICAYIRDITERKMWEKDILFRNSHDSLTGLYNRNYLLREIDRCDNDKNQLPISIIVGDINGFKIINDALGHEEGDNLIIKTASLISSFCRHDDVLARIGGDEFGILLPKTSSESVHDLIMKINEAFDNFNRQASNRLHHITIALGGATKTAADEPMMGKVKIAEDNMHRRKLLEQRSLRSSIIASIKTTLHEKSHETEQHAQRLIELSKEVGRKVGLSDDDLNKIELLSMLHDIGKIGINESILNKRGKLTDDEWVVMRKHPEIGYRIAMASGDLIPIANYILCHHERWDGQGYPQGLTGDDIPLLSRIISVVDTYDAMTQDRSYRKALSKDVAIAEIVKNAGTQFDPSIVKAFVEKVLGQKD